MAPLNSLSITVLFFFFSLAAFSQDTRILNSYYMTEEENKEWLNTLISQNKNLQWHLIRSRYFYQYPINGNPKNNKNHIPVLVIEGKALELPKTYNENMRDKLLSLFTHDSIQSIEVVDREPDESYANKTFSGYILVTLNNKKVIKKWQKMALE